MILIQGTFILIRVALIMWYWISVICISDATVTILTILLLISDTCGFFLFLILLVIPPAVFPLIIKRWDVGYLTWAVPLICVKRV